jgi:cyclophilin family peptidyl-prolyl cis-trans isomerase
MKPMNRIAFILIVPVFFLSCNTNEENPVGIKENKQEIKKLSPEALKTVNTVLIETEFGNMKVKLYNQTPKHKANFLKLVNEGFYNDLLFHRVINQFMIQGGDPDSKNAAPGVMLGNGGPGYDIDAEFNDSLFHKKGVIAAAREGDDINQLKKSSGSQFYLVQGNIFTDAELNDVEIKLSTNAYIEKNATIKEELMHYSKNADGKNYNKLIESIRYKKDFVLIKIPEFKRKIYKETGGVPHLDNNYTVFGEVIEGLDVIEKIAGVSTDGRDRPMKDIKMSVKIIAE